MLIYQAISSWVSETESTNLLIMLKESIVSGIVFDIKYNKPSISVKVSFITCNINYYSCFTDVLKGYINIYINNVTSLLIGLLFDSHY